MTTDTPSTSGEGVDVLDKCELCESYSRRFGPAWKCMKHALEEAACRATQGAHR